MSSKYPVLTPREVERILLKAGFSFISQKGSHKKYSDGIHTTIVPNHDVIYIGTLRKIIQQSGMSFDTFISYR